MPNVSLVGPGAVVARSNNPAVFSSIEREVEGCSSRIASVVERVGSLVAMDKVKGWLRS